MQLELAYRDSANFLCGRPLLLAATSAICQSAVASQRHCPSTRAQPVVLFADDMVMAT